MAVYTKINQQDIAQINSLYQSIGDIIQLTEIIEGIDNSNYLLIAKNYQKTVKQKYILTIFESRINPEELPYFFNFTNKLKSQQINCPSPILNIHCQQTSQIKINNLIKHLAIVEFIEGKILKPDSDGLYRQITVDNCQEVGKILAKMHLASIEIVKTKHNENEVHRHNDMGVSSWREVLNKIKNFDNRAINSTKIDLDLLCKELEGVWQESKEVNILEAPCHLDLFPDNVFFDDNGKISGVIDFYFSANDYLIFDLAIAIKDLAKADNDINIIGTRHGEKLYETLCTREEMVKAEDMGDFYRIPADNRDLNYSMYFSEGEKNIAEIEDYHSHNAERLNVERVKKLLLNLSLVRKELFSEEIDEYIL